MWSHWHNKGKHHHHRHPHLFFFVVLRVEIREADRFYFEERILTPNGVTTMNPVTFNVGHTDTMSIAYFDALGNPMLTPPMPDAPPTWTDTTPATATLTAVGPSNLTATEVGIAAGSDTVTLSLSVGGVAFTATQVVNVTAAAQVLTSIGIVNTIA